MRSSRSKRKEMRKFLNMREGNTYENIALIKTIHDLVREAYEARDSVKEILLLGLKLESHIIKTLINLQKSLKELQTTIKQNVPVIWPENLNSIENNNDPQMKVNQTNLQFLGKCRVFN